MRKMSEAELATALGMVPPPEDAPHIPASHVPAFVHDLEVHQFQLEMENRSLREAVSALEASRRRYQDLYDLAPIAHLTIDTKTVIEEANLTAAGLLGIERGRLIGRVLSSYVVARDRPRFREHVQRCLGDRAQTTTELAFEVRRSSPVTIQATSTPLLDDQGVARGCRTTLTDVSALKRSEQRLALLANASRLLSSSLEVETIADQVLDLVVPAFAEVALLDVLDERGVLRRVARRFASPEMAARLEAPDRLLGPRWRDGAPQLRVLATGCSILMPEGMASKSLAFADLELEPLLKAAGARSLLFAPLSSRMETRGVLTLVSTESHRAFSPADVKMVEDLSARLAVAIDTGRVYQRAREAVRAREEVLAFVAHDLRNPVHAILLTAGLLGRGAPPVDRRRGWKGLERVRRLAEQMGRMIDDLLDLATIDAGQLSMDLNAHDAHGLLTQVSEELQPLALEKDVELQAHAPFQAGVVRCDRRRVLQAFSNIVGNAIKFTPTRGNISVGARICGHEVVFSVDDTGPGIQPENLPRLFDRYWQADEHAHKGRGLGLYIAKRIVEAQGGAIWAETRPGLGTTISFSLPRDPGDRAQPPPGTPSDNSGRR